MTELMEVLERAQDESLKAIKAQHEQTLAVLDELADGVRTYWANMDTERFSLPDPRQVLESYIAFNRELVQETRAFTDRAFAVWAPEPEKVKAVKKAS